MVSRLVSLPLKDHLLRLLHAWLNEYINAGLLELLSASIESKELLLVLDRLSRTFVDLTESDVNCNINVFLLWWDWFIHSLECSAEVTALNIKSISLTVRHVRAEIREWIVLKEEFVENLIAVPLILVSTSENTIWTCDSSPQTFLSILLIDRPQLSIRKDLVGLTDGIELSQVHLHLLWTLHWMVLQSILFESTKK